VQPDRELAHIHYFCGNVEIPSDLQVREPQRVALYKAVAELMRAYAALANDLVRAGYDEAQAGQLKHEVETAVKLREIIRKASGETIDLKAYEADMRHLIDTYIEAEESRALSRFGEVGLLDLIANGGLAAAVASLPKGLQANPRAVAETIANNVRSKIIKDHLADPAFYETMSALLAEVLADLNAQRIGYEEFLKRIAERIVKPMAAGRSGDTPAELDTPGKRRVFNNLRPAAGQTAGLKAQEPRPAGAGGEREQAIRLALEIDATVRRVRPNGWRGNKAKENVIKAALMPLLDNDPAEVERLFEVIKAQTEY
jgi:type I restriction enzyme R subunit